MRTDDDVVAYIGLDWGDQRHAIAVQPAAGGRVEHSVLEQRPDTLHAWVAQLRRRFGGRPVGIALEQRKGAVVHALLQYEFLVLYPINPKALARYREALHPSGAKDDPTDAALLLDLLRAHRAQLRPWVPDTVEARRLQLLCEHRRKLVNHRVALTNRLTSLLKQYFPQALDWVGLTIAGTLTSSPCPTKGWSGPSSTVRCAGDRCDRSGSWRGIARLMASGVGPELVNPRPEHG